MTAGKRFDQVELMRWPSGVCLRDPRPVDSTEVDEADNAEAVLGCGQDGIGLAVASPNGHPRHVKGLHLMHGDHQVRGHRSSQSSLRNRDLHPEDSMS